MATITVSEFALALDTDARTARKFLRAVTPADAQPGKGSRWAIEKREVRSLTKKFTTWRDEVEAKRAEKAEEAPQAPENDDAELEGPSDEELLAIDAE